MYNPKNVFGMDKVKVIKDKGVYPCKDAPKPDMKGVKTSGIRMRGYGAATKGRMCRGPMA
jgi:hypothetical protein